MSWLITGGAGYIGSHIAQLFDDEGLSYYCYDNLSSGLASRIRDVRRLIIGDIRDEKQFTNAIIEFEVTGVIHLAGKKSVDESKSAPLLYEETNLHATRKLLEICAETGVSRFIFSSTAAVYGEGHLGKVDEDAELFPISPYGETKLKAEQELTSYIDRGLIQGLSLRYFNVIGQSNSALRDESVDNLVPKVLSAIQENKRPQIYGSDYATPDGTCIRDYVDVRDIAALHLLICKNFKNISLPTVLNVGTGTGVSVLEVMETIYSRLDLPLTPDFLPRRQGDPQILVADARKLKEQLGFTTRYKFAESIESLI
jgi:UDP-glucose 4-epimerase